MKAKAKQAKAKLENVIDGSELSETEYWDFRKHTQWATIGLSICGCSRIWPVILHKWLTCDDLGFTDDLVAVYECTSCGATSDSTAFVGNHRSVICCVKDTCDHG